MPQLTGSAPHFLVGDLLPALDYYVDVLGFARPPLWGDPPVFAMPTRDAFIVMLNQVEGRAARPQGDGIWDAYFWCDNADELFAEFADAGARIAHPPEDRPLYGNREFAIQDLDGHLLAFGADL